MKIGFTAEGRMSVSLHAKDIEILDVKEGSYLYVKRNGDQVTVGKFPGQPKKGQAYRLFGKLPGYLWTQMTVNFDLKGITAEIVETVYDPTMRTITFRIPQQFFTKTPNARRTVNRSKSLSQETTSELAEAIAVINTYVERGKATLSLKEGKLRASVTTIIGE